MGGKTSKPVTKTDGVNSNTNSISIFETVENHTNITATLLILILLILFIHSVVQLYAWHKRTIKRSERLKSRINLNAV